MKRRRVDECYMFNYSQAAQTGALYYSGRCSRRKQEVLRHRKRLRPKLI